MGETIALITVQILILEIYIIVDIFSPDYLFYSPARGPGMDLTGIFGASILVIGKILCRALHTQELKLKYLRLYTSDKNRKTYLTV